MFRIARALAPLLVLSLFAGSCAEEEDEANDPDRDSATLRRQAMDEWYNEAHTLGGKSEGGPWSREYRAAMLDAAKIERQRWGSLLPGGLRQTLITGSSWSNLGPTKAAFLKNGNTTLNVTDSGRIAAIVPDGTSKLYVATAGGGAWKHDASGWTPLSEALGSLSCGALAMDPTNHSRLYLGLGDPFDGTGIGFLTSSDAGATWTDPLLLGDSRVIPQILISPADHNILLVATDKGLYRSTNGGTSFALVNIATGQTDLPYIWTIAATGTHSLVLSLEATHSATTGTTNGQVWYSTDDGASWTQSSGFTKASGIGRATVAAAPSALQTVYAMAAIPNSTVATDLADLFKSTDGGKTWTALNATTSQGSILNGQGWYNQLLLVDPTNPNTFYIGGALYLAKTTNGGTSFTTMTDWLAQNGLPYVHADFHAGAFDSAGNLYVGTDGGLFESTNGGTSWTDSLNVGMITHLLYSVGSSPAAANSVLGGMQDNGTRIRETTTTIFDEVIGGDGFGCDINRGNGQQMLGSLYYDDIRKSTNGGSTWSSAVTGLTEHGSSTAAPFITRILAWEGPTSTGNEIYTFANFKIYKSTNYAGKWTALPTAVTNSGAIRNIGVAAKDANVVGAVGSGGRVWLSKDGGTTWTMVASGNALPTPPTPPDATALPNSNLSLSYIHFDVSDTNTVYVASVAPNAKASHLWKSTNFGSTWTAIDANGLPVGDGVNVIKSDPNPDPLMTGKVLYAGTHMGVYRSSDGGATWSRFGANMPLVSVQDLYISPDESIVRAATYGRGFWQLDNAPMNNFSISANPTTVTVVQGQSGMTTINTAVTSGAAQSVALTVSGLPAGASANFNPTSVTAGAASTLTLTAGAATPAGTYSLTVTGTGTSATHTTSVSFVVTAAANDFTISANPTTVTAMQGTSGTTSISTAVASGTAESIALTATGVPTGATATFTPASVTAGGASTLTLAAGTAATGTYTITVKGTAPSAMHTTTVTFTVTSAPANDFGMSAMPSMVTVAQGASGTTAIDTTVTTGAAQSVALSASGLPAGATAAFSPASVTAGGASTLTLTAAATTPVGMYSVTVTGTGASATHTTTVTLKVTAQVSDDFSISANSSGVALAQGMSGTVGIDTQVTAGAAQSVALSASGLPAGATAAFSPASVTAGASSTLTLTAGSSTAPGTYTVTVTGTGASATHSTTVTLTVMAAAVDDFDVTATPPMITVAQGGSATTSIGTMLVSGSIQDVTVTVDALPAGVSAAFDNPMFSVGGSATLTVNATAGALPGNYSLMVTATGTSATHSTTVTLVVEPVGGGGNGGGGGSGGGSGGCGCTVGGQPQHGANVAGGLVLVLFGVGLVGWRRRR
jgi:uncharacterized membrane protein